MKRSLEICCTFKDLRKPLLLEEMHCDENWLIHDGHAYISPIEAWIEGSCSGVCFSGLDCCIADPS